MMNLTKLSGTAALLLALTAGSLTNGAFAQKKMLDPSEYDTEGNHGYAVQALDYVRSVPDTSYWYCEVMPEGQDAEPLVWAMILQIDEKNDANATITASAQLEDTVYRNRMALSGKARASMNGTAYIDLADARLVEADALPAPYEWSSVEGTALNMEVEETPESVKPYMIWGKLTNNLGTSQIYCQVRNQ